MSFKGTAILIVLGALGASSYGQDRDHDRDHGSGSSHSRSDSGRSDSRGTIRSRDTSSNRDKSTSNRNYNRAGDNRGNDHRGGSRTDSSRSESSRSNPTRPGYSRPDYSRTDHSRSSYSRPDYSNRDNSRFDSSRFNSRPDNIRTDHFRTDYTRVDSNRNNPNSHGSGYSTNRPSHNDGVVFRDFGRDGRGHESNYGPRGGERIVSPGYHNNEFRHDGPREGFGRGGDGRVLVRNNYISQRPSWGGHWRDSYVRGPRSGGVSFDFGFYLSTPYEAPCYVSPWYYYSSLPAYIPASRVVVMPNYRCDWDAGVNYDYNPAPVRPSSLDVAIDGLTNAYRNGIAESLTDLIPGSGSIGVFVDGKYQYSVGGDEFQEMFEDSVKDTETESFEVESVKREGDQATVHCRHEVKIPNGGFETIYQTYHLQREDGRFVITDFLTSHSAEY